MMSDAIKEVSPQAKGGASSQTKPNAANKKQSSKDKKDKKPPTQAKAKDKKKQDPKEVMKKLGVSTIYENDRGEFFTNENYALLSVDQNRKKITEHRA